MLNNYPVRAPSLPARLFNGQSHSLVQVLEINAVNASLTEAGAGIDSVHLAPLKPPGAPVSPHQGDQALILIAMRGLIVPCNRLTPINPERRLKQGALYFRRIRTNHVNPCGKRDLSRGPFACETCTVHRQHTAAYLETLHKLQWSLVYAFIPVPTDSFLPVLWVSTSVAFVCDAISQFNAP